MRIEDDVKEAKPEIGFYPDALTLQNFYRDSLTKTYSRAYLENFMPNFEQAQGVIVVDVDKFKEINDTYGHIVGDEFLVILKEIEETEFYQMIRKIKQQVLDTVFEGKSDVHCSVSVGGAYCVYPLGKAIEAADRAMYQDKFNEHIFEGG